MLTLASLFDGIGGFPLCAVRNGVTPVLASEIEPFPIMVTRKRFPQMQHLGNVSKINGADVPPVDIITFGSPCQDLSVAGKQAGIHDGARSSLFFEAVRIIKEMRASAKADTGADEPVRPRWAVWENVPGAYSSHGGRDFQAVLQALASVKDPAAVVPLPPKGKWQNAGCIVGDGYSLAWRTYDAQYWAGTPQRRKRIYIIADFDGERAGEILFKREGRAGYIAQGGTPGQGIAADFEGSPVADDRAGESNCVTPWDVQSRRVFTADGPWPSLYGGEGGGHGYIITVAGGYGGRLDAVKAHGMNENGDATNPNPSKNQGGIAIVEAVPYTLKIRSGCEGGGKGALVQTDKSATLATNNDQYLFQPAVYPEIAHSLTARHDGYPQPDNGNGAIAPTITGDHNNRVTDYSAICVENSSDTMVPITISAKQQSLAISENLESTIGANDYKEPQVVLCDKQRLGQYGQNGVASTLAARDYKDCADIVITSVAQPRRYIVRRLTPLECCRLQGYPDGWTEGMSIMDPTEEEISFWLGVWRDWAEINGKKPKSRSGVIKWLQNAGSDAAEYKAYGNSLAIPCANDVIRRIAEFARRE